MEVGVGEVENSDLEVETIVTEVEGAEVEVDGMVVVVEMVVVVGGFLGFIVTCLGTEDGK